MNFIEHKKMWTGLLSVGVFLLSVNVLFVFFSPNEIVAYVGVDNTYLTTFLIAAIGGVNSFTSGVLYSTLVAFAAGGANPWLLGVCTGVGIAIGDVIMFSLFQYGYQSISNGLRSRIDQWTERLRTLPRWLQFVGAFSYLGFFPLPNDILMFLLVTLRFKLRWVVPLVIAGGMTTATLIAHFGTWW